jgi:hypothetical protein
MADRNIGKILLKNTGKSACRITSTMTETTKHSEVNNFMGAHNGIMLLKTVRLKIQPVTSRKLIINTIVRDVHIINLNDFDVPID